MEEEVPVRPITHLLPKPAVFSVEQFTDKERQLLITAITEAEIANGEYKKAQNTLAQAKEELNIRARIAQRTYKTIMVLRDINPDAYELSWSGGVENIQLKIRSAESKETSESKEN